MKRRGFLQLLAMVAAAPLVPASARADIVSAKAFYGFDAGLQADTTSIIFSWSDARGYQRIEKFPIDRIPRVCRFEFRPGYLQVRTGDDDRCLGPMWEIPVDYRVDDFGVAYEQSWG